MSDAKRCPRCQGEIPAGAPEGLCPQCLLQAGLQPKTAEAEARTAPFSPSGSRFEPPTPEALQSAFPHLEILELLGKGGMGAVYKARQPGLDRLVAVKILPPEVSEDPAFAERFTREARALAMLNHPNIVGIHDFGQTPSPPSPLPQGARGGYWYFVMEFMDGVNLRQAMRTGELTAAEALKIVPQICEALQFAHDEGIVHRDIKPENILLDSRGRVKIADFGLAKLLGKTAPDVSLTGTQQIMGTMHYMAPEQFEGARGVDHRADIYSLGVTFYEMLTGELPIGRFAAPSKKVQIDVRLDEVVLRSLEKAPEQRYQHASEIKTEMDAIARGPAAIGRPSPTASGAPARTGYLRAVVLPMALLCGLWFLVISACTALGWSLGGRAGTILQGEVAGFLLVGGWFLLPAVAVILNGVWLYRLYRVATVGGYLRTVVFPFAVWCTVLLVVACVLMATLRPSEDSYYVLGDPRQLAAFGAFLAGLGFVVLNSIWFYRTMPVRGYVRTVAAPFFLLSFAFACAVAAAAFAGFEVRGPDQVRALALVWALAAAVTLHGVWFYRTMPAGGHFRKAIHVAGWTLVCAVLFVLFWTPCEKGTTQYRDKWSGYIDCRVWPYQGFSECAVSLEPSVPTCRRLIIREKAESSRSGYAGIDPDQRVTTLTYDIELQPLNGEPLHALVDALNGMSCIFRSHKARFVGPTDEERAGTLLDATSLADWLASCDVGLAEVAAKKVGENPKEHQERLQAHAAQARALIDIIRRAAKFHAEGTLHLTMHGQNFKIEAQDDKWINRLRAATDQTLLDGSVAFVRNPGWNATENVKWQPVVPILYAGVPLMLAVWGVGLWLLLRRRGAASRAP